MKTVLAAVTFPFVYLLALVAMLGLLVFSPVAREQFFSDRRHKG
jgi:hypothetical protein